MFVIARRSALCHDRRSHNVMNIRSDNLKTLALKVFRLFRKIAKSGCYFRHACPSVCFQGTFRLSLGEFSWNWYLRNCRKSVEKMHVSLKSDKNDGYFTRRPMYIYDSPSMNSSQSDKYFGQNCRGNQNTHFRFNNFFPRKSFRLWDSVEKYGRVIDRPHGIIWRVRFACCVNKARDQTHSEWSTVVKRTSPTLTLYVHFLSCWYS
jgi:hypothetical protein